MADALIVFAQAPDARIAIDAWSAHAERFFGTRLGLAEEKRYATGQPAPREDDARVVIAPAGELPGIRAIAARPCVEGDLALAAQAEGPSGGGLALLARRCPTVWRVAREGDDDLLALRLAAILASVLLGPVVDPRGPEIFGVKTARAKLDAAVRPTRGSDGG